MVLIPYSCVAATRGGGLQMAQGERSPIDSSVPAHGSPLSLPSSPYKHNAPGHSNTRWDFCTFWKHRLGRFHFLAVHEGQV